MDSSAEPHRPTSIAGLTSPPGGAPRRRQRGRGPRITLYCAIVGAVIFLLGAGRSGWLSVSGLSVEGGMLAVCLAIVAVAGALALERRPWAGMAMLILTAATALARGSYWLLPAALVGTAWAGHESRVARRLLGFLLLIPGIAGLHVALMAVLSFASGQPLPGLPDSLNPPLNWTSALQPLWLLPAALAGAWLLTAREQSGRISPGADKGNK